MDINTTNMQRIDSIDANGLFDDQVFTSDDDSNIGESIESEDEVIIIDEPDADKVYNDSFFGKDFKEDEICK